MKITYADKVALNENSNIAEINKVTAGNMNEIKTVVNGLISNTYGTSQTTGYSQEYVNDYIKIVAVNNDAPITLEANGSADLDITIPTYEGYKLLGCVGGYGVGETGLIVNASDYSYINSWVFNSSNYQKTFGDVVFILLYVKTTN